MKNIKEILAAVAGVLLLILQIINVVLSHDIEESVAQKAAEMRSKADALAKLVNQVENELHKP